MSGCGAPEVIEILALSRTFDLARIFADANTDRVRVISPDQVTDPARVDVALSWAPEDRAFDAYPNLRMVSSIAAGVDRILTCPSLPPQVVVTRIRDQGQADMMAGFAAWHVVWHHRRMGDYVANQASRTWDRSFRAPPPGRVRVGILGYGLMGQACARAIAAMGFPVLAARSSAGAVQAPTGVQVIGGEGAIQAVAAQSDILINTLPLTDSTRDLLDAALFAQMPKGAVLVQIGRGEHLVEADLLAALDSGQLSAASIDVFRVEPPPDDHPFWGHPNILVTPHRASDSSRPEILRQIAENYQAVREGRRPPGLVDRASGY
ncbi:2-hydroxyacid dehydrogenase [Gemmobacter nectariphilus]|uniref:2-hydroxyacid dehydrogenase n=1 Tax=Gemmobacter nectariphilus TaxID=220343 RepID=UPI000403B063|nr:glyoxylate/hydroxypyruvate reductase A [Gemmobacter nectariphilus]